MVSGEKSISGKPTLASDPHLHGSRLPGPWYFAQLSAPGLDVAGSFFPGLPTALIGHNRNIAWGITNMGPDVQDLFIEEINPEDSTQYMYQDQWLDFDLVPQSIRIKDDNEEAGFRIKDLIVRKTIHGPLVKKDDELLALSWTGHLFNGEMEAFYRLYHATDWGEFSVALSHFPGAPQNFVYADTSGNIGYYGAGKVPLRKSGSGLFPVPGWSGEYDWVGFIPFEEMPHIFFILKVVSSSPPMPLPMLQIIPSPCQVSTRRIIEPGELRIYWSHKRNSISRTWLTYNLTGTPISRRFF